jgi:hypothetical protein
MRKSKSSTKRTPGKGRTPVVVVEEGQAKVAAGKRAQAAQGLPQQKPPVAATEEMSVEGGSASAEGTTAAMARQAEIGELPTMSKITGLKPVEQGVSLSFVPLRDGDAAECHATEKTSLADGAKKCMALHGMIDDKIESVNPGEGLVDYVPGGCVDIKLRNARSFKSNHLGIFEVRVLEEHLELMKEVLLAMGMVVFETIVDVIPDETYEIIVEAEVFPASVIDQIYKQTQRHAYFKRDLAAVGDKAFIYQFVVREDSELMAVVSERGWFVELGKYGKYTMRQAKTKVEYESIFVYGMRGLASAKLDFKPAFAGAVAQSNDMIRLTRVPQLMHDAVVCVIKYPFSRQTSDAVDVMLDQGQFRLVNDRTGSKREIYVAGTLKELQKMLMMKLVRDDESSSDSDEDEEPVCLDVTPGGERAPAARSEWRLESRAREARPRATRKGSSREHLSHLFLPFLVLLGFALGGIMDCFAGILMFLVGLAQFEFFDDYDCRGTRREGRAPGEPKTDRVTVVRRRETYIGWGDSAACRGRRGK